MRTVSEVLQVLAETLPEQQPHRALLVQRREQLERARREQQEKRKEPMRKHPGNNNPN